MNFRERNHFSGFIIHVCNYYLFFGGIVLWTREENSSVPWSNINIFSGYNIYQQSAGFHSTFINRHPVLTERLVTNDAEFRTVFNPEPVFLNV